MENKVNKAIEELRDSDPGNTEKMDALKAKLVRIKAKTQQIRY